MIELDSDGFHAFMAAQPMVACVLHRGSPPAWDPPAPTADEGAQERWAWARIDLAAAPAIAVMFAAAGDQPQLLVMRDKVVLSCAPLPAPQATRALLGRAAALDMARVRAEIEQEQAGRASLFARRVCPTAWRNRRPGD